MRYRISHYTRYAYPDAVPLSHNLAHLQPRATDRQNLLAHRCAIEPAPSIRRDRLDFFGNHETYLAFQEPHHSLALHAVSEVELYPVSPLEGALDGPWEAALHSPASSDPSTAALAGFRVDSPAVCRHRDLADYAGPSFAPGRPLLEAALDLARRIQRDFAFVPGSTAVGTPVLTVLRQRRGVCQDFAHLQIGCLRSIGLAARYVSGYLRTSPPPGSPRLHGADASHAWLAVYCPGIGWVELDPTNGMIPADQHITLGYARDYDDLAPVKGVILGGQRHALEVKVDVEAI